eukprot:3619678-Amphidinium_carterae.1
MVFGGPSRPTINPVTESAYKERWLRIAVTIVAVIDSKTENVVPEVNPPPQTVRPIAHDRTVTI